MRLTQWTDYALRLLMYCAVHQQREHPITISEVAQVHNISRSHLTKIVQDLAGRGLLETTRGRGGGMRLLRPAQDISLGTVVRAWALICTSSRGWASSRCSPTLASACWACCSMVAKLAACACCEGSNSSR